MKLYELKDVKKHYGRRPVLDVPALSFEKEKLYVIYGPNAAGKTTLLNLLAFLDRPDEGEIRFYGNPASSPRKNIPGAGVTMVMQNPYLFGTTVLKNVISGLTFRFVGAREAAGIAAPVMSRLGLWDLKDRQVNSLSGGERRKVALARAAILDTDVLLLDEPTVHVDSASAALIEELIHGLIRDGGKTIIMTTHDLNQARRVASDIVYLIDGRPGSTCLRNVFIVNLAGSDGVKRARFNNGTGIYVASEKTGSARIVIDPEDIIISREPVSSSALNSLAAVITGISKTDGLIDVTVDAGMELHAFITRKSLKEMRLDVGDKIFVTFKASAIGVYDA